MIDFVTKVLPLFVMIGGGVKFVEKSSGLLSVVESSAVQTELSQIAQVMRLDALTDPQSVPTPEAFSGYIKRTMTTSSGRSDLGRDHTLDRWGQPYRLVVSSDSERVVASAGPDKRFGTEDVLIVKFRLY
jgi:hypothetical protein